MPLDRHPADKWARHGARSPTRSAHNPVEMIQRHLIVSAFPPSRCGVGTYAAGHLEALRDSGASVRTASPLHDSKADSHFDVSNLKTALKWLWFCMWNRYDFVHVHYADRYYFKHRRAERASRYLLRIFQTMALRSLSFRSHHSSVIIHEIPHHPGQQQSFVSSRSFVLSGFDEILFHTASMREACLSVYPSIKPGKCRLIEHDRFMKRHFHGDKSKARMDLGLHPEQFLFLCIGFIQESKGFDDVVRAFAAADIHQKASLHIVGSNRSNQESQILYTQSLIALCDENDSCYIHPEYLSDEQFDCWLAAADLVFLPYRGVVSSGVGARAGLYQTPIAIRSLPNLMDQFPNAMQFKDHDELVEIISNSEKPRSNDNCVVKNSIT